MHELTIDLETIPDQRPNSIDRYIELVKPPGRYSKPESIEKWMEENAEIVAVENWKKSALHGIAGEVCSIAWAFDDETVQGFCGNTLISEREVIAMFFDAISDKILTGEGRYPTIRWIGHNLLDFDLRFLYQRCVINDIEPPVTMPVDARQGSDKVYDTMKAWAGWKGFVSQDALIEALEIDVEAPDTIADIDGSMVWDLYQAGRFETILNYNKLDVVKARAIYKRLTWAQ